MVSKRSFGSLVDSKVMSLGDDSKSSVMESKRGLKSYGVELIQYQVISM